MTTTIAVKLRLVCTLLGLLLLSACQRQSDAPSVAISSGQAVYAGTFSLEPAVAIMPAQSLIHVETVEAGRKVVAFVSDEPLTGALFTLAGDAQLVASDVITAELTLQANTLSMGATANDMVVSSQQTSPQNVTHALDASFVDASLGDLDGNGFTLVDIVNLLNIVVGNSNPVDAFATYHADVNCDNVVNISDVLFVLRKFVGIEQAIPMCPPNLSLDSGQTQTILLGNPLLNKLTDVNVDLDVPAGMTVTDVSSADAFGIALQVSATQSGVAVVTIGGEIVRVEVTVASTPPTPTPPTPTPPTSTTITLRLVAADTQENAAVTGLPLTGAPLVLSP
jgi:hypothetical protein